MDIPDLPHKLKITSKFEDGFVKNEKYNQLIEDQFGMIEKEEGKPKQFLKRIFRKLI